LRWATLFRCGRTIRPGEVRRLAQRAKDAAQTRRLLAIAAVLDGASREAAAKIGGMDRQTLRDWVIRFNEQGPDGLINKSSPGAPGKLTEEHKALLDNRDRRTSVHRRRIRSPTQALDRRTHPAWLSRFRRITRDFERCARTVAALIHLAMIRIMLKRLVASPLVMNRNVADGL
jgi:transposase